jgi:hypothetical protein
MNAVWKGYSKEGELHTRPCIRLIDSSSDHISVFSSSDGDHILLKPATFQAQSDHQRSPGFQPQTIT